MRIKFAKDHDEVEPTKTVSYKEGDEGTFSKDRGEALVGQGVGAAVTGDEPEKAPAPRKGAEGGR